MMSGCIMNWNEMALQSYYQTIKDPPHFIHTSIQLLLFKTFIQYSCTTLTFTVHTSRYLSCFIWSHCPADMFKVKSSGKRVREGLFWTTGCHEKRTHTYPHTHTHKESPSRAKTVSPCWKLLGALGIRNPTIKHMGIKIIVSCCAVVCLCVCVCVCLADRWIGFSQAHIHTRTCTLTVFPWKHTWTTRRHTRTVNIHVRQADMNLDWDTHRYTQAQAAQVCLPELYCTGMKWRKKTSGRMVCVCVCV